MPVNDVTEILNGRRGSNREMALCLGHFDGKSNKFWFNLKKPYDLPCAEHKNGAASSLLPTEGFASRGELKRLRVELEESSDEHSVKKGFSVETAEPK